MLLITFIHVSFFFLLITFEICNTVDKWTSFFILVYVASCISWFICYLSFLIFQACFNLHKNQWQYSAYMTSIHQAHSFWRIILQICNTVFTSSRWAMNIFFHPSIHVASYISWFICYLSCLIFQACFNLPKNQRQYSVNMTSLLQLTHCSIINTYHAGIGFTEQNRIKN